MNFFQKLFLSSSIKHQKSTYSNLYSIYGNHIRSLHWSSKKNQEVRFGVITDLIKKLSGKSVLDVGCGFGDLCHHFNNNQLELDYSGVDLVDGFVNFAKTNYIDANWYEGDFVTFDFKQKFDVIIFCGTFAFGNKRFFELCLKKALDLANVAVVFNLYSVNNSDFFCLNDKELKKHFSQVSFKGLEIIKGYLRSDVTYCLLK